jgi:methylthioxylose transferase
VIAYAPPASRRTRTAGTVGTVGALTAWVAVVAVGRVWGLRLIEQGVAVVLYAPPLLAGYRRVLPDHLWVPVVAAIALVAVLPWLTERLSWRALLVAGPVAALVWWLALALVAGWRGVTKGLFWRADYAETVPPFAADPSAFLSSYVDLLPGYPIALRGHPPGIVGTFAVLEWMGLSGPGWAAAVTLLAGALTVPALLVTTRLVAGETAARHALPFVVLAPAALWIATSTDALSMGTAAWVVALLALAGTSTGRRADVLAAAAGLLALFVAMQSYGLVLMAVPVGLIAWSQQRWRPTLIASAVAAAGIGAFALVGFWWFAGLSATMHEYHTLDLDRPYRYFVVNNVAAWALALGPATAVALVRLRDPKLWLLVGGGLGAALVANLSGLSLGEVERIWLPFTAWVLLAGAALWTSQDTVRLWLALQASSAIVLTSLLVTNW